MPTWQMFNPLSHIPSPRMVYSLAPGSVDGGLAFGTPAPAPPQLSLRLAGGILSHPCVDIFYLPVAYILLLDDPSSFRGRSLRPE